MIVGDDPGNTAQSCDGALCESQNSRPVGFPEFPDVKQLAHNGSFGLRDKRSHKYEDEKENKECADYCHSAVRI